MHQKVLFSFDCVLSRQELRMNLPMLSCFCFIIVTVVVVIIVVVAVTVIIAAVTGGIFSHLGIRNFSGWVFGLLRLEKTNFSR